MRGRQLATGAPCAETPLKGPLRSGTSFPALAPAGKATPLAKSTQQRVWLALVGSLKLRLQVVVFFLVGAAAGAAARAYAKVTLAPGVSAAAVMGPARRLGHD